MSDREASQWFVLLSVTAAINFIAFVVCGYPISLLVFLLNGWAAGDSFAILKNNGARP